MKIVKIEVVGESPMLMNNPAQMLEKRSGTTSKLDKYDPAVEVVKAEYRNKDGKLYVPARCMFACLLRGTAFKKAGKYAAKKVLAGNVRIGESELILEPQQYAIDVQPVVIQRQRVLKARPRFDNWKLKFSMVYNDEIIGDPLIIKDCLDQAGKIAGLLDWGARNGGSYGGFRVSKFEPQ